MKTHRIFLAWLLIALMSSHGLAQEAPTKTKMAVKPSQRWALLIGVNDYANLNKLEFCGRDMEGLRDQLLASGFPKEQVFLLHDKAEENRYRPSKNNIERQLHIVLNTVEQGDLLLVAFSGHGTHLDSKSYLCPNDAEIDDPTMTMVALDSIYDQLSKCPAALKLFLVDACRNDPRPGGQKSARAIKESSEQFTAPLERPPQGILLLTSCAAGEISMEAPEFGHGVFMNYILEGLQGKGDADSDSNGSISLMEMFGYARKHTKLYVAHKFNDSQRPGFKGELVDDFDITQSLARAESLRPQLPASPRPSPAPQQPARPSRVRTNSIGMKLTTIPAGEFLMGSPESEKGRRPDEGPQHRVRITRPFEIGMYEVTQAEYGKVMGTNPSYFSSSGGASHDLAGVDTSQFPVESVSWAHAQEFCGKLSKQEGKLYRLPTEAEWEFACRAGSTSEFHFGNVLNGEQANCDGNYPYGETSKGKSLKRPTTVGSYRPNDFGIYDMHGNVWEWCSDKRVPFIEDRSYDRGSYTKAAVADPQGAPAGDFRMVRGGAWDEYAVRCRSAYRVCNIPGSDGKNYGFRVVCEVNRSSVSRNQK